MLTLHLFHVHIISMLRHFNLFTVFASAIFSISLCFLVGFPINTLPFARHNLHKPDNYANQEIPCRPTRDDFFNDRTGLMANFFWYPAKNTVMSQWLNFRATKRPLKQRFASVQSANGINLLPLLRAARYFQGLISTGFFLAADVPPHPTHHQGCLSDRGAAHQNAIRTLLATRRTHAQNASCGGRSVPFNSSSRLPLHFTVSLCPPNSPSTKQTEQSIQWHFFWFVLTNQLSKRWVLTPGWLSMNWVRDSGRRRCGHVNKSISGALDGWDL